MPDNANGGAWRWFRHRLGRLRRGLSVAFGPAEEPGPPVDPRLAGAPAGLAEYVAAHDPVWFEFDADDPHQRLPGDDLGSWGRPAPGAEESPPSGAAAAEDRRRDTSRPAGDRAAASRPTPHESPPPPGEPRPERTPPSTARVGFRRPRRSRPAGESVTGTPIPDPEPPAAGPASRLQPAGESERAGSRPSDAVSGAMPPRVPFPDPSWPIDGPESAARQPFPTVERRDWAPAAGVASQLGSGPHPEGSHAAEPAEQPWREVGVQPWPEVAAPRRPAPASRQDRNSRDAAAADPDAPVRRPLLAPPAEPAAQRALGGYAPPRIRSVTGPAPWPDLPRSALAELRDDEGAWLDRQVRGADPLADEQRSV